MAVIPGIKSNGFIVASNSGTCYGRMEWDCTAHMSEVRGFDAQSLPGRQWRSYQVSSPMALLLRVLNFEVL